MSSSRWRRRHALDVSTTGARSNPAGAMRAARAQLIGGLIGMVLSAALIFYGLGFAAKPHRLGLAVGVAAAYLVVSAAFNSWLWRRTTGRIRRAEQMDKKIS